MSLGRIEVNIDRSSASSICTVSPLMKDEIQQR